MRNVGALFLLLGTLCLSSLSLARAEFTKDKNKPIGVAAACDLCLVAMARETDMQLISKPTRHLIETIVNRIEWPKEFDESVLTQFIEKADLRLGNVYNDLKPQDGMSVEAASLHVCGLIMTAWDIHVGRTQLAFEPYLLVCPSTRYHLIEGEAKPLGKPFRVNGAWMHEVYIDPGSYESQEWPWQKARGGRLVLETVGWGGFMGNGFSPLERAILAVKKWNRRVVVHSVN